MSRWGRRGGAGPRGGCGNDLGVVLGVLLGVILGEVLAPPAPPRIGEGLAPPELGERGRERPPRLLSYVTSNLVASNIITM
jgi:hypothetical protein